MRYFAAQGGEAMAGFEKQIVVNASPDQVFTYLADFTRHDEWTAHPVNIQQTSEGAIGAGSTFTSRNHFMGRDLEDALVVKEFVSNERLVFEADGNTGLFRHVIEIQPVDGGSRVTKSIEALRTPLIGKLLAPVLMFVAPRALTHDLERIKAHVEADAA